MGFVLVIGSPILRNLTLSEMMDQEGGTPSRLVEDKEEIPETPRAMEVTHNLVGAHY